MADPFLSVIIPTHNKAPHVGRALSSVINQEFDSMELIIVDDASTDGSGKIVERFDDRRIRKFQRGEAGLGGYAARNLGIRKARGQWVAFLDADDEWLPGHLRRLFELLEIFPMAEMLGCGWYVSDGAASNVNKFARQIGNPTLFDVEKYVEVQGRGTDVMHTNVVALRRRLITAIGGFPTAGPYCKRAGDGQTWLRCMLAGAKLGWRPEPGAIYYQDSVNMVTRSRVYDLDENCLINFLNEIVEKDKNISNGIRRGLKRYRDSRILSHLVQSARSGQVTWKHVLQGVRHFRFDIRLLFIFIGWVLPWAGKGVFKVKDRLGGVHSR